MTDKANVPTRDLPTPAVITIASRCSVGAGIAKNGASIPGSGVNPFTTALDMIAYPLMLSAPTYVYKAFWINGSAPGGNYAIGIYDSDFKLIVQSASTAGTTTSLPQAVTLAAKLPVGLYYVALASDSITTQRLFRWSIATTGIGFWKMAGCWRQSSVTLATLPNPATPVVINNIAFPVYGLITRSGFDV